MELDITTLDTGELKIVSLVSLGLQELKFRIALKLEICICKSLMDVEK